MGAWIETFMLGKVTAKVDVAPRVGAWIETADDIQLSDDELCRTPCGCVD